MSDGVVPQGSGVSGDLDFHTEELVVAVCTHRWGSACLRGAEQAEAGVTLGGRVGRP